ncbi:MAG: 50S ribosomal protein L21, partial [Candidatus Dormibacteraeota bacterium]|nr:50S ribosomal protein L21 [Candidatus Dormibacteraeota bacterium]
MYAILKHGGHQYRVTAGDRLLVDRLSAEVGSKVTLEPVLLVGGDAPAVGTATVDGARVVATVVAHRRGRKLRVFTYKPKKRHRRTLGYRSQLTELQIDEVTGAGGATVRAPRRAETPTAPPAKAPAAKAPVAKAPVAKAPA